MKKRILLGCIPFFLIFLNYFAMFNHINPAWVGLSWNVVSGEKGLMAQAGWYITPPWVLVAQVDTRPVRVCITSASRGYHCRLVQFNPSSYKEFLATEGFRYYWWDNRLSFNLGYKEEYRGMRDMMRGYGFGIHPYPFISVLEDR